MAEEHKNRLALDDNLAEKLMVLISETQEIDKEKLSLDGSFEEAGLTSLNALSIAFEIENEFGITIRDEDALHLTSIREVVKLLQKLLAEADQPARAAAEN